MPLNYGQTFSGVTTWSIPAATHGLGHKNLRVQLWDASTPRQRLTGQLVIDASANITITFLQAQSGLAVVNGAAPSPPDATGNQFYPFASSTTWTIPGSSHGFGTDRLLIDVYDASTPRLWLPNATVTIHPSTFTITVSWLQATAGVVIVCGAATTGTANPGIALASNPQTILGASHGLGTANLGVQIYDTAGREVLPGQVTVHPTTRDVVVSFLQSQAGTVVLNGSAKVQSLAATTAALSLSGTTTPLTLALPVIVSSLSLAGSVAIPRVTMPLGSGSHALAGTAVALRKASILSATAGSSALAGTTLTLATLLSATSGPVALTGTLLTPSLTLPGVSGALSLAGTAVSLRHTARLVATSNAASVSGTASGLGLALSATSGTTVVAGLALPLRLTMAVQPAALDVTGTAVALKLGSQQVLSAEIGVLTLSGTAATLRKVSRLSAASTPTLVQGQTVAPQVVLPPASAALSLLGPAPALRLLLGTAPGALALTGQSLTPRALRSLAATTSSSSLVGQGAPLRLTLAVSSGSSSLAGTASPLRLSLAATPGTSVLAGTDVSLVTVGHPILTAQSGSLVLSGTAATLRHLSRLPATGGGLVSTGTATALRLLTALTSASMTVTGTAAGLRVQHRLQATTASLSLAGTDAGLRYGSNTILLADPAALALGGTAATLRVQSLAASGSLAMASPAVLLAWHRRMASLSASLDVTGSSPGLTVSLAASPGALDILGTASAVALRLPLVAASLVTQGTAVQFRYSAVPPVITVKPGTGRLDDADAPPGELAHAEAPAGGLRRSSKGRTPVLA
jgi:hypothetical protein